MLIIATKRLGSTFSKCVDGELAIILPMGGDISAHGR